MVKLQVLNAIEKLERAHDKNYKFPNKEYVLKNKYR